MGVKKFQTIKIKNMKKIVFFVLLTFSVTVKSQNIYSDRKKYDVATKNYNDAIESYDNYLKKINFYKNYKYPKNTSTPKNWFEYFKPILQSNGIKLDNYLVRYHKNVIPDGSIYVNFVDGADPNFLSVTFTNTPPSEYFYSAFIYKFNHPGQPPVLVEEPKKEKVITKVSSPPIVKVDTIVKEEPKTVKEIVPQYVEIKYLMPDGKKYTYESLIRVYPSMSENKVFTSYFKN